MFPKVLCICFLFLAGPSQQSSITRDEENVDYLKLVKRSEPVECKDDNSSCAFWAAVGECKANPEYMMKTCRKSCRVYNEETCKDDHPACTERAKAGECKTNPIFMLISCRKSCETCGSDDSTAQACKDDSVLCPWLAGKGDCKTNPSYMSEYCKKSCDLCRCDVKYNGKCFWAVVHDVQDVNFTNAANLCKESGGHGAEIYNKEHYDKIIEYLRTKIPSTHPTEMEVWTGVKFNQNTGVAYNRDGNTAFAHWYPGHPYTGSHYYSDWTGVRFRTESVASSSTQGMMTGKQIWEIFGALCEK